MTTVLAPVAGQVVRLDEVDDDVFSQRIMGDGVAVRPVDGEVRAPIAGRIEKLFPGGHGIAIEDEQGLQILVHVGLETVHLRGDGFSTHVTEGAQVTAGDLLVTVDLARLRDLNVDPVTPVVVLSGHAVDRAADGTIAAGETLFVAGD